MPAQSKASEPVAAATEQVTVAPRRTVFIDGVLHLPGTILKMAKEEAARLRRLGFLHDTSEPEPVVEQTTVEEPGPTVNGEASTTVRPK